MLIVYDDLTREELIRRLDKTDRLFDVAYRALLVMTVSDGSRDLKQDAIDAVALIKRYPNDPAYISGYTPPAE